MIVKATLSIGFIAADREDEIEIPDEELDGLDANAQEQVINKYLRDWAWNYIEISYKRA
jgi:hypothetical protein